MNGLVPFVAADVGNTSIKIALASSESGKWSQRISISESDGFDQLEVFLDSHLKNQKAEWLICSVCRPELERLLEWLKRNRPEDEVQQIGLDEIPLVVSVEFPDQVGKDRLVAATMAANLYSDSDLVVIDSGTAVTVDAVSKGQFLGGTIFPGSQTEFEALRLKADQLPLIDEFELPENPIGKSTAQAIQSGVLHGQVGAICHVANLIAKKLDHPKFVTTGGGLLPIKDALPDDWHFYPNLVLDGIRSISGR